MHTGPSAGKIIAGRVPADLVKEHSQFSAAGRMDVASMGNPAQQVGTEVGMAGAVLGGRAMAVTIG
jgi:hypothetical protein